MFRRKLQFLVAWKGYRYEEHSWVDKEDVSAPDSRIISRKPWRPMANSSYMVY
jgi:hypothetical protein